MKPTSLAACCEALGCISCSALDATSEPSVLMTSSGSTSLTFAVALALALREVLRSLTSTSASLDVDSLEERFLDRFRSRRRRRLAPRA